MNPRSLKIFDKKKGFFISTENIVAISITVLIFLIYYLKASHNYNFGGWETLILILGIIYLIGLMFSNYFRYQREIGNYGGNMILWEDRIQIKSENYRLEEIKKLEFIHYDIKGKFVNSMLEFSPHLSNGIDNLIIIKLKDGKEIRSNFLQTEYDQLKNFRKTLIHYYKNGIVGWLHLLDILEIQDYVKIQEFKKEITIANNGYK